MVDIQGVGDLYTDPQIHTARGTEYGDGNLGTKGMALFFHSHHCNDICMSLGLTPFDLSQEENQQLKNSVKRFSSTSETRVKLEDLVIGSLQRKSSLGRSSSGFSESTSDVFSQTSSRQVSEVRIRMSWNIIHTLFTSSAMKILNCIQMMVKVIVELELHPQ